MNHRPIILCFVAYYLPGYRAGGPLRTIANLVEHLGDEFDIRIITRDRDMLDSAPYPNVAVDDWNAVSKAQVFYASERLFNIRGVANLLCETPHDVLYLNSFFDFSFTGLPLFARWLGLAPRTPCVIAPRGEFSTGAIALKATKKRAYLLLVKALRVYDDLHWQASSEFEAGDIRFEFGFKAKIIDIAPDLPQKYEGLDVKCAEQSPRLPGSLRIVFLSRISPKKNLDYLLGVLRKVNKPVDLAIYGPLESEAYWLVCQRLITELPANITVTYQGEVNPDQVHKVFSTYDLFTFPTRGENYGHVILESLAVGTPVLISDQTPWLADLGGGVTTLSLLDQDLWAEEIMRWAHLDELSLASRRKAARQIAYITLTNAAVVQQNRELFIVRNAHSTR